MTDQQQSAVSAVVPLHAVGSPHGGAAHPQQVVGPDTEVQHVSQGQGGHGGQSQGLGHAAVVMGHRHHASRHLVTVVGSTRSDVIARDVRLVVVKRGPQQAESGGVGGGAIGPGQWGEKAGLHRRGRVYQ